MRPTLFAAFAFLLSVSTVLAQSADRVDRASARSFETRVQRLESTLQSHGFMIVSPTGQAL